VKARIAVLIAGEVGLVLVGLWAIDRMPSPIVTPGAWVIVGFAIVLAVLTLLPRIYLEHARHNCWVTPADSAILVGLFTLGPIGFVLAAVGAEALIAVRERQPAMKLAFNLVNTVGGYTAAAVTFAFVGRVDPLDPVAWAAGLAAMGACAVWDLASTAALFAIAERRPFREVLNGVGPALLISLTLAAALGLVALVLLHETPFGALLVVPVMGVLLVSTRSVSRAEAERHRLERLYAASRNLTRLLERDEARARVAAEARTLVTGAAAVCASARGDHGWAAGLIDDDGARELPPEVLARLRAVIGEGGQGVLDLVPGDLPSSLADHRSLVWATGQADPDTRVLLVVLHEHAPDERAEHRVDVLHAFANQAATVLANVELHHDVQEALEHQVALNRQKSEFVAAVSHELRTPLAGMLGAVQTVQRARDRMSPTQLDDVLEMGRSQGARLRSLIEDLLLVAAAEHEAVQLELGDVPVAPLLSEIERTLRPVAGGRVRTHVSGDLTLRTDRHKLHRILANLVDNARKYAPAGPIDVRAEVVGDTVRFTVDDTGRGIEAADRERIFDRFVQLDQSSTRRQGGTGLGLHLSRELAELLGGSLTVTAAPAGGARFVLRVPRQPSDAPPVLPTDVLAGARAAPRPSPGILGSPLRPRPRSRATGTTEAPTPARPAPSAPHPVGPTPDRPVPTLAGGSS
jgi:signal transduction histidine kinase